MLPCRLSSATFTILNVFIFVFGAVAAPAPPTKSAQKNVASHRPVGRPKSLAHSVRRLQPVRVMLTSNSFRPAKPVVVSGSVRGADGLPLPGATVWVAGSRQLIAVANESGDFSLTLPTASPVSLTCGYTGAIQETTMITTPSARQFVFLALPTVASRR